VSVVVCLGLFGLSLTSLFPMSEKEICVDCDPQRNETTHVPVNSLGLHTTIPHNPLDSSTFVPPNPLPAPTVTIEYCDRVSKIMDHINIH
jgi:hypothetical protein